MPYSAPFSAEVSKDAAGPKSFSFPGLAKSVLIHNLSVDVLYCKKKIPHLTPCHRASAWSHCSVVVVRAEGDVGCKACAAPRAQGSTSCFAFLDGCWSPGCQEAQICLAASSLRARDSSGATCWTSPPALCAWHHSSPDSCTASVATTLSCGCHLGPLHRV